MMVLFYEGLTLGWSCLMKISFKGGPFMKVSFYNGLIFLNLITIFIFLCRSYFMVVSFYDCDTQQPFRSTVVFLKVLGTTFQSVLPK